MITEKIEQLLNDAAKKIGLSDSLTVSFSNMPKLCDFQCNDCFKLAKTAGLAPLELAEKIVANLEKDGDFYFEAVKPAFINIKLTDQGFEKLGQTILSSENCGLEKHKNGQRVILDYGGANIAKTLHVGHLRPAIIGEAIKRLYQQLGDSVISDVHLGDWGLQLGLTELQLFEDGVLDFYFGKSDKPAEITLEMLNEAYPKASTRSKVDDVFREKAEEWTLKIQKKEQPYFDIYKKIKDASVPKIKANYQALGAQFDEWYGESDSSDYVDEAIAIIEKKGLLHESDGAMVVDVATENENIPLPKADPQEPQRYKNPMPPAIIKKSNGAVLYATTDIATILMRNKLHNNPDRIEYITDQRQAMHFTQVFRVCKLSGISPENQQLLHIGHGTMNGKDGKPFKTREGGTLKLEDMINLLIEKAGEKLKSNGQEFDRDLALKIGVAAMKFGDLINNVGKDYVFDLDKFLSFEGKTGPYLQYTAVRINSILAKVENVKEGQFKVYSDDERDILRAAVRQLSSYEVCYKEKSLAALCASTFDLASAFSTFYNNHSVIGETDEEKKSSFVQLLKMVKKLLAQALHVLAIEVPEKM